MFVLCFQFFANSNTVGVVWVFVKLGWNEQGDSMGQYGTVYTVPLVCLYFLGVEGVLIGLWDSFVLYPL